MLPMQVQKSLILFFIAVAYRNLELFKFLMVKNIGFTYTEFIWGLFNPKIGSRQDCFASILA